MRYILGRIRIPVDAKLRVALVTLLVVWLGFIAGLGLFAYEVQARDDLSYACPSRTVRALYVLNDDWTSQGVWIAPIPGTVPISNCKGLPFTTQAIAGGGAVIFDLAESLCNAVPILGVAKLELQEGTCAEYFTEATFRGGEGVVAIPELPEPLGPRSPNYIRFTPVRTGGARSTFVALIPDNSGSTRAAVSVFDGDSRRVARHIVNVEAPFTWYEIPDEIAIGSIQVENVGSGVGPDFGAGLYAVTFSGFRSTGSPRVVPFEVAEFD